ncbi:Ribokinase [Commensalibacter sp. Nvir]|uniref:ribokinase n=1 Tax=Commensalibacter sp. Nvir TaxID=3069817 RepID=UPI002D270CC9|nr:Ribokinase [Commensalibacter sp. Nvir]
MKSKRIVVMGSTNQDIVNIADRIPKVGETIIGYQFMKLRGGKGANQAVAASKLGGNVIFITCLGNDDFASGIVEDYKNIGMDVSNIEVLNDINSGTALIMVDAEGRNCISVAPNANSKLTMEVVENKKNILINSDYFLVQMETPIDGVEKALKIVKDNGGYTILNPAPARALGNKIFKYIDIITPNETEAEILTGINVTNDNEAKLAAKILFNKGVKTVIITLGSRGAYLYSKDIQGKLLPSYKVDAVDTTAAGDTFNGALIVALSEGHGIEEAIGFANKASAISILKVGA